MNLSFFYKVIASIILVSFVVLIFFSRYRVPPEMDVVFQREKEEDPVRRSRVLIVHSYERDYAWTAGINRGLLRVLSRPDLDVEVFYMDTKVKNDATSKVAAGRRALGLVDDWHPDLVIACDDNAQRHFASYLVEAGTLPVVFCGVNFDPARYGYPGGNVTGVRERPHYAESVAMFKELMPNLRRLSILTDRSETSDGVIGFFEQVGVVDDVRIVDIQSVQYFGDWQHQVEVAQTNADLLAVYTYHTVTRRSGKRVPPKEVFAWTQENSRIPVVGFLVFSVDEGALGGVVESSIVQGMTAGRQALEILAGSSAGDIPVVEHVPGLRMLNVGALERYGLQVSDELLDSVEVLVGEPQ